MTEAVIQFRADIAPFGKEGLVKLSVPAMPRFIVFGLTEEAVLNDAPICIAALVNIAQGCKPDAQSSEHMTWDYVEGKLVPAIAIEAAKRARP